METAVGALSINFISVDLDSNSVMVIGTAKTRLGMLRGDQKETGPEEDTDYDAVNVQMSDREVTILIPREVQIFRSDPECNRTLSFLYPVAGVVRSSAPGSHFRTPPNSG